MIATVRDREALADAERIKNQTDKVDELADEIHRLREQLDRERQSRDYSRVLIAATRDETIEIFADPKVKIQVVCIPDTRTPEEFEKAVEWALSKVPLEFKGMMDDSTIKPNLYSVRCLDRTGWRYYSARMEEFEYLKKLGEAVETVVKEQPVTKDEPW